MKLEGKGENYHRFSVQHFVGCLIGRHRHLSSLSAEGWSQQWGLVSNSIKGDLMSIETR